MSNLTTAIQSVLDESGRAEQLLSRAEDDIAAAIANKCLEIIGSRDIISETDKAFSAATGMQSARAIIDKAFTGFGKLPKGQTVPRHLLAESLSDPEQQKFFVLWAMKPIEKSIETSVMKRVRARSSMIDREVIREGVPERTLEVLPIRTDGGVWTGDKSASKYPAPKGLKRR